MENLDIVKIKMSPPQLVSKMIYLIESEQNYYSLIQ